MQVGIGLCIAIMVDSALLYSGPDKQVDKVQKGLELLEYLYSMKSHTVAEGLSSWLSSEPAMDCKETCVCIPYMQSIFSNRFPLTSTLKTFFSPLKSGGEWKEAEGGLG